LNQDTEVGVVGSHGRFPEIASKLKLALKESVGWKGRKGVLDEGRAGTKA